MDPNAQAQTPPPPPAIPGAWATPPASSGRSKLLKILIPIGIGVLVLGGLAVVANMNARKDAGKVLFTTTLPVEGDSICSPKDQVTSVKDGTPVYAIYFFSSRPGDATVKLTITKDGGSFMPEFALPVSETKDLDCVGDTSDLSALLDPGVYKFTLVYEGKTISEGTLTITE